MLLQMTVSRRKEEGEIGAWLPNLPWVTLGLYVTQGHSPTQDKKKAAFSRVKEQEGPHWRTRFGIFLLCGKFV